MTTEEALEALALASGFDIKLYDGAPLHRPAMEMAGRFQLPAAYDAHYLALAEQLEAELWTADKKLARAVGAELERIHLLEPG